MKRRHLSNAQPSGFERGQRFGGETFTRIPAEAHLRPLRDQIIVEPLGTLYSRYILVERNEKPLRGIVKAVGPGHYAKRYDSPLKHKRTKTWDSKHFTPTQVKVGDVVELGGAEIHGYAFETFYWGDVLHLHAREADVCGIRTDLTADEARAELNRVQAA